MASPRPLRKLIPGRASAPRERGSAAAARRSPQAAVDAARRARHNPGRVPESGAPGALMRIAIILPSLGRGGAERVALELGDGWAARHEVSLLLLWRAENALETGLETHGLGGSRPGHPIGRLLRAPLQVWRLARALRRLRPEAIVSFMEAANLPAAVAAALVGRRRRLIATLHTDVRCHRPLTRIAMRLLYPHLRLVTPTEGLARELVAARLASQDRIAAIPNPAPSRPRDRCSTRPPLPATHALPPLPVRYLAAVGRLAPEKDFRLLLEAYARVADRVPDLVVAGEGPEREALAAEARRLGLGARVHLPGHIEDVPALLRGASLLVLASRREGWSLAIVEALAAGCPVVAVDCPHGPREILADGRHGVLVTERSAPALGEAISATLADAPLLERLRREGPERAAAYRRERILPRWEEILASLP